MIDPLVDEEVAIDAVGINKFQIQRAVDKIVTLKDELWYFGIKAILKCFRIKNSLNWKASDQL